jgi:LPS export ABC transporter protein LptC
MNWRWVAYVIVLGAAAVVYLAFFDSDRGSDTDNNSRKTPLGYYLKDAVITDTTPEGNPRARIAAENIEQNPADNSVQMQTVRVDYLALATQPWTLTSEQAYVPSESKTITFSGDVTLRGSGKDAGAVIRTRTLSLDTEKQIAKTRDDVTIALGSREILSHGLTADLKTEKLKLESSHGRFVPR